MRDEFMKRIDARNDKKNNKEQYDIASYPFGAEEMLLKMELNKLDKEDLEK